MASDLTAQINIIAVDAASNIIRNVGQAFSGLWNKIPGPAQAAIGTFASVGAATIGIGTKAVQMAADYQSGLTSLVTGAGEAQSNMGLVSAGILNLAQSTGTSTKQLTDGMYMIESAGFRGAAGLAVLKASAEGAKVGNADLGTVADATTTLMLNFGLKSSQAGIAVNTLIATVANGKTTMQQLSGSLSQILPTAAAAGVGLNDTMAAMATMTGEGVPAANAATYLRQTILGLEAPSAGTVKALQAVGLSSTQVADEMKKSLPDTLQMITDAVGKKFPPGSAAYVAAIKNISGGAKTMQGMLDLTGVHLATFKSNVVSIAGAVKQGGSSITGWSAVQGTFNAKMDEAKSAVEVLMIKIGQALLPTVTSLMTQIVPLIVQFSDWITKSGVLQQAAGVLQSVLGRLPGAIKTIATDVQNVVSWYNQWKPIINGVALVLLGLFIPAIIKAGVEAVISGTRQAIAFVANIVKAGIAAWEAAGKMAIMIVQYIASGTQAVIAGAKIAGQFVLSMVQSGTQAVIAGTKIAINFVGSIISAGVQAVIAAGKFVASLIPAIISFAAQALAAAATAVPAMIAGFISWSIGAWSAAAATIAATWPILLIIAAVALLVVGIVLLVQHWGQVTTFLRGAWQAFTAWLMNALHALGQFFSKIWDGIISFLKAAWAWIVNAATVAFKTLILIMGGPILWIALLIYFHWNQIMGFLKAAWAWVLSTAQQLWAGVIGVFTNAWSGISNAVLSIWNWINNFFGGLPAKMLQFGINLVQGLINGILNMFGSIGQTMNNLVGFIGSFLPHSPAKRGELSHLNEYGPNLVRGVADGITKATPLLQTSLNLMTRPIGQAVASPAVTAPHAAAGGGGVSVGDIHVHLGDSSSASAQSQGRTIANVVKQELANALRQQSVAPRLTTGGH